MEEAVVQAMIPYYTELFGNPSSQHEMGVIAERAVTDMRNIVANALGVKAHELIFTSGATESVNMALLGIAQANKREGMHIVTSSIEHECVLETCRELEEAGYSVTYIAPDKYGYIEPRKVVDAIRGDTVLVAIMHVNNELGTINDVHAIARDVKTNWENVHVFVDGVQAFGKLIVNLEYVDSYAFSGHKMHGPKGVGGLYIKEGTKIKPLIVGGGQEMKLRSGTENVPAIVGLGKATEIAYEHLDKHKKHIEGLKRTFLEELSGLSDVVVNSPEDAISNTLNISLLGVSAEILMHALEEKGVYVSTGSACSANNKIKSHVLEGIGVDDEVKNSAIRVSFSHMNKHTDVSEAGKLTLKLVNELRG